MLGGSSSRPERQRVVVTGLGPILAGASTRDLFWRALRDGVSQLAAEPDPLDATRNHVVGRVDDAAMLSHLDSVPARFVSLYPREIRMYLASVYAARQDASLDLKACEADRIGLFAGSARPTYAYWYQRWGANDPETPPERVSRRDLMLGVPGQTVGIAASLLGVRGPTYAFTGTCSAGAIAIGHAFREIQAGLIDVALATGHDAALVPPLFAMYEDANLRTRSEVQEGAVRAFVGHSTNAFAEGSMTLVLESLDHAERRGATIVAELVGYDHGNNGYHPTAVDVSGVRPAALVERLLRTTDTEADGIDVVVGHGNGVQLSDVSEQNYMKLVFRKRAREVPLVSTKPVFGHTLGAASAVNVAALALMLREGFVIPTINIDESRLKRNVNHQPNHGEARPLRNGLTVAYGMGGLNTVLLLRPSPEATRDP